MPINKYTLIFFKVNFLQKIPGFYYFLLNTLKSKRILSVTALPINKYTPKDYLSSKPEIPGFYIFSGRLYNQNAYY